MLVVVEVAVVVAVAVVIAVVDSVSSAGGVKSKRFGEPSFTSESASRVAALSKLSRTSAGVADELTPRSNAAAPATCGVAMEVPDMVRVAVSDVDQAEVIELPGANISKHDP